MCLIAGDMSESVRPLSRRSCETKTRRGSAVQTVDRRDVGRSITIMCPRLFCLHKECLQKRIARSCDVSPRVLIRADFIAFARNPRLIISFVRFWIKSFRCESVRRQFDDFVLLRRRNYCRIKQSVLQDTQFFFVRRCSGR